MARFSSSIYSVPLAPSARSYVADLLTPVIRVGVTGLARSGKTVFITALVRCLCEGRAVPSFARLRTVPGFRAYLEPQPDDDVPRFAFEDHLEVLGDAPPSWPQSTRQISQLRLTLEWDEPDVLRRMWRLDATQRLHVDIIDYPGEWLIDLGLLEQSFDAWSADVLAVARSRAFEDVSAPFLSFVASLEGGGQIDEATAIAGAEAYVKFLRAARAHSRAGNVLGPGRFLMPGDLAGTPQLTFFPAEGAASSTALLSRRFESYKTNVARPFFEKHFAKLDRQIVLVDVLGALNGGADALNELEHGLENVLRAFRPGKNTWLSSLFARRRIERIVFAATKSDHIHGSSRPRLEAILKKCVARASQRAEAAGADLRTLGLSALRATEDVEKTTDIETYRCVRGILDAGEQVSGKTFDGHTAAVVFPGDLPSDPLDAFDAEKARPGRFHFARFRPPRVGTDRTAPDSASEPWPHINLDAAFAFLLGDDLP